MDEKDDYKLRPLKKSEMHDPKLRGAFFDAYGKALQAQAKPKKEPEKEDE